MGPRFDVLDVPVEAGLAALRHLSPGSPVAVRGGRMWLLLAPGSADELPGLLEWLEWAPLSPFLDLTALGPGSTLEAPLPPARFLAGPTGSSGNGPAGPSSDGLRGPRGGCWGESPGEAPAGPYTDHRGQSAGVGAADAVRGRPEASAVTRPATTRSADPGAGDVRPTGAGPGGTWAAGAGRSASQGAAVWLRPPVPGCEVEASLPTMSALGGDAGTPDLVRVVETVATQCHRIRLRRACAQPLAFS